MRRKMAVGLLVSLLSGFFGEAVCRGAVTMPYEGLEIETGTPDIGFQWEPIDGASSYKLKLLFNDTLFTTVSTTNTALTLTSVYTPGYYTVFVCGITPSGRTPWTAPVTFMVLRTMTPSGDPVIETAPAALKWTRSGTATRYLLKLSRYDQATGKFVARQTAWIPQPAGGTPRWVVPAGVFALGRYRWSITDYAGDKPCYSSAAYFTVALAPPEGMALIPSGRFNMGDSFNDGYSDELPVHEVYVSEFYMDSCEVSKALWSEVRVWALAHGYTFEHAGAGKAGTHPVQTVSWFDAVKWCNARSQMEGRRPAYYKDAACTKIYKTGRILPVVNWAAIGYRLPTEAEWERAARGGASGHRFPWSDADTIQHGRANYYSWADSFAYDTSPTHGYHPSFSGGEEPFTSPVGSFAANGYGLYDMAGNVFEMCWDWYSAAAYESSRVKNPAGPASGTYRVMRGGNCGFFNLADLSRVSFRGSLSPDFTDNAIGFRTVLPSGQ